MTREIPKGKEDDFRRLVALFRAVGASLMVFMKRYSRWTHLGVKAAHRPE